MSYIKKSNLPKERIPTIHEKNNCLKLKNIKYIHDYTKFNKFIIQPFLTIIKPDFREKLFMMISLIIDKIMGMKVKF